jgi:hypothetical protein
LLQSHRSLQVELGIARSNTAWHATRAGLSGWPACWRLRAPLSSRVTAAMPAPRLRP